MPFNPFTIDLPVREIIPAIREHLAAQNTLIVNAPPGAGKSTLLPLAILDEVWLTGQKIIMLEPRRLAAKTIAERLAQLLGEEVGQTVGYRIRFETRISEQTRIEVVTEGILTRMIHSDRGLAGVGIVIFDEFHERSIHADVAMALCREAQHTLRPDLRILVMSATLDMPQLTRLLKAPVAQSMGRQYPVETIYSGEADDRLLPDMTARVVQQAAQEREGDILVFLPGENDIRKVEAILRRQLRDFKIHPLFGMLPFGKQYAAIMPDRNGKRKVVLATSIAETSLTIEGVSVVVDTGFGKTSRFDPKSGLSRLETVRISKDAADQRAGRAGRLGPGTAYRMWSKETQERMAPHRTPEILEADLASLVLDMAQWGIIDIRSLTWLNPPPRAALASATDMLHQLQALENCRITEHGKKMHALPCHSRIAHMLLKAADNDQVALASDIAAILEERDPMDRNAGIDINLRIEALRRYRDEKGQGKSMGKIEKVARSYRSLFSIEPENGEFDGYETGVLLTHCYPERIAYARPGNNAQFQLANGTYASAGHRDDLAHEPWLAIAHLHAGGSDNPGRIFLASPLNPRDLAPLVKQQEAYHWDVNDGELTATLDTRIGSIVLQSKPLPTPDEKYRIPAISEAIKQEGEHLLDFSEEVRQWQLRVGSLRKWRPQEGWPDVSTPTLLMTNWEWLRPYLADVEEPDDLLKIELLPLLEKNLDADKQARLDVLAPPSIKLPDGSYIELEYQPAGAPPKLEIRLQDVLNWQQHPHVDGGDMTIELHLLTPDLKLITAVSDLESFWQEDYPRVKKQLEVVFPKVAWERV
ncbi:ATP-dependent helicase HrpB [Pontibacter akesuensis]|uniref:ATP-dependent helicase HrpB n=1 Tax=Pontibacter akesuensis TaxID=388950 RepID=A0A1I7KS93_9BACT|nr:ATP-dependent helicase HrpB [Pontibacter akesuensis]GHA80988.1 ATP-dependent helicase HrpB [Pontibacter akesuensis]SFV00311.1 ATP-dependent helicase HrpB [Pontibacter akesuensis]